MAKWTKQTYEMVANKLYGALLLVEDGRCNGKDLIVLIAKGFAYDFSRDNPNFSPAKFIEAVETGKHIRKSIRSA